MSGAISVGKINSRFDAVVKWRLDEGNRGRNTRPRRRGHDSMRNSERASGRREATEGSLRYEGLKRTRNSTQLSMHVSSQGTMGLELQEEKGRRRVGEKRVKSNTRVVE